MSQLPDYVASAKPNPSDNRAPWLTTTAAAYAGVMLWFAFWQEVPSGGQPVLGGVLSEGLGIAMFSVILAALLCHFLFYYVPGMLGMKTGLSLTVVGTSTFGTKGGFIMPGFLMGALQFGWLSVNAFFAGFLLAGIAGAPSTLGDATTPMELSMTHQIISVAWILVATFVGMKGVRYVGMVASFTPVLPIIVLALLLVKTIGGVGGFNSEYMMAEENKKVSAATEKMATFTDPKTLSKEELADYKITKAIAEAKPVTLYGNGPLGVISLVCAYIIGFFATAGAAGVGFCSNNKDAKAVNYAGLVGIAFATCLTGIIALLVVAGAQQSLPANLVTTYNVPSLFGAILGDGTAKICMLLLCIAAFPSACFPTLVAADAFKTTFPKINPMITCGIGVFVAIILSVTGLAGRAGDVFTVVGASFGPIVGAMVADYLLSGKKWAGPRDGFNLPGWVAWFFGFIVGGATLVVTKFLGQPMPFEIPCPPLSAFIVGFVLYYALAKAGMESKKIPMPQRIDE